MALGSYSGGIGAIAGGIIGGIIGAYTPIGLYQGALLGASIGGMAGGVAGQTLWPEKVTVNHPPPPQPHENRQQISTYGSPIPIVYESSRLAGNIIYMQNVNQTVTRSKHRQDGVRYYEIVNTYSSTFAIAFCEGPVIGISRIWVNGKIFADYRDPTSPYYPVGSTSLAAANLATTVARAATYFSIYLGTETQTADSTLVGILTDAETPSYRGICYIVFIDFPVGEFSGVPQIEIEIGSTASIEYEYEQGITDDCGWIQQDTYIHRTSIFIGNNGGATAKGFLRFPNITIPQGTTITSANLYLSPTGGSSYPARMDIKIEEADNPANVSDVANYLGRSWSSAMVNWDIETSPISPVESTDIKTLIQSVINRPGWSSGNALSFTIVPAADAVLPDGVAFYITQPDPFDPIEPKLIIRIGAN